MNLISFYFKYNLKNTSKLNLNELPNGALSLKKIPSCLFLYKQTWSKSEITIWLISQVMFSQQK